MTVLVLGGYGAVGGHVVDQLRRSGDQAITAGRDPARAERGIDLTEPELNSYRAALTQVDTVVNASGAEDPRLAEVAGHRGCAFVDITATIDYMGVEDSGVYAYMPTFEPRPDIGDLITIEGTPSEFFGQIQLDDVSAVTVIQSGVTLPPYTVLTPEQADAPEGSVYESILVAVQNVTVTEVNPAPGPGDSAPNNQYVLDGEIRVDDHSYLTEPFPEVGETFATVRGVLRWGNNQSQLLPQSAADVIAGAPSLDGIDQDTLAVFEGASESLTVSLTRESSTDTTVDITCSASNLTCPATVVILAGDTTADFTVTGASADAQPVTVTATIADDSDTASVRVYNDASTRRLEGFDPESVLVAPNAIVPLTLSLDIPAGPGGTEVTVFYAGAADGPDFVTVAEGDLSATFNAIAGANSGSASLTATLGSSSAFATIEVASVTNDPNLYFSRYIEGSGSGNKAVEITNATGAPFDAEQCTVQLYRNGSTTPQGSDWTLDDVVLQPGEEYVLCNNGFSQPALCDQLATIDHNGDDILTLTCSGNLVDSIGHQSHLHQRDTNLVLVSRAPLADLEAFRQRMGWSLPWYSSHGSRFNYDYHATTDEQVAPVQYNYRDKEELLRLGQGYHVQGEQHGLSVFLRDGGQIYHTYSCYGRGVEMLMGSFHFLDLTPFGRGEGWDGMPDLDGKGLDWTRLHDEYEQRAPAHDCCAHKART